MRFKSNEVYLPNVSLKLFKQKNQNNSLLIYSSVDNFQMNLAYFLNGYLKANFSSTFRQQILYVNRNVSV